ncbi:hypothetical protein GQ55_9G187500 [Panicum hallii var. hallii]|uniref:Uncharacterized protein n=1 Tax=Panicum hallii var. hallii TaxID=1504633 RepID=A0A2T7C4Q9_9POAL|nr:hypothetical protein GQ55_9G187500 [Panicum hallii var. hallii]
MAARRAEDTAAANDGIGAGEGRRGKTGRGVSLRWAVTVAFMSSASKKRSWSNTIQLQLFEIIRTDMRFV